MKHREIENRFQALLDDTLSVKLRGETLTHLESCASCKQAFVEYKAIAQLEGYIARDEHSLLQSHTASIMSNIEALEEAPSLWEQMSTGVRLLLGGLSTVASALLIVFTYTLNAYLYTSHDSVKTTSNPSQIALRDISLEVPSSSISDLRAGSGRVDIVWGYTKEGKQERQTLAHFVKVIDKENTRSGRTAVVRVRVPSITADKIQLAMEEGYIEVVKIPLAAQFDKDSPILTVALRDPNGRMVTPAAFSSVQAVAYLREADTAQEIRHVLRNGRWISNRQHDI